MKRLALVVTGLFLACSEPEQDKTYAVAYSSLPRRSEPAISPDELKALSNSNASFAVDLLHALPKDANVFFSPHGIDVALAMTYAGARGTTAEEMKKALHFDLADARLHDAFDFLDLQISVRGGLTAATSLWTAKGRKLEGPFLDTLAVDYGSALFLADFGAPRTRGDIDGWVATRTAGNLKGVVPDGVLDASTSLVLVNALSFGGPWLAPFDPAATAPAPFAGGASVPTMHETKELGYVKGTGFEAVSMPYATNSLELVTIVPDDPAAFEESLTGEKLVEVMLDIKRANVDLSYPQVKIDTDLRLAAPLEALGMKQAFSESADFGGITKAGPVRLREVLHKTFLRIDERGAALQSNVVVIPQPTLPLKDAPVVVKVDRPFLVAIMDRTTRAVVFLGRIVAP